MTFNTFQTLQELFIQDCLLSFCGGTFQDTQFAHLLQESLEFFNIAAEHHGSYFLADTKTSVYRSEIYIPTFVQAGDISFESEDHFTSILMKLSV